MIFYERGRLFRVAWVSRPARSSQETLILMTWPSPRQPEATPHTGGRLRGPRSASVTQGVRASSTGGPPRRSPSGAHGVGAVVARARPDVSPSASDACARQAARGLVTRPAASRRVTPPPPRWAELSQDTGERCWGDGGRVSFGTGQPVARRP